MSEKKRFGIVVCENAAKWGGTEGCGKIISDAFEDTGENEWVLFKAIDGEPPRTEDLEKFDGFLFSGSASSVNDEKPWMIELEKFIQELAKRQTRAVGVCFGHQLIGKALGGSVGKNPSQRFVFKAEEIEMSDELLNKPWFNQCQDSRRSLRLLESHSEAILEPPKGSKILASSASCENEVALFGPNENLLGIQFHPEGTTDLFKDFILPSLKEKKLLSPEEEEESLASMDKDLDSKLMLKTIVDFLRQ